MSEAFQETAKAWRNLKENYAKIPAEDRDMFWCHFAVAPAIIVVFSVLTFGWPVLGIFSGWLILKASDA